MAGGKNWRRLIENLATLANVPSRIAKSTAARLTPELKKQFKTGADTYGTPWVPLAPSTIRKKGGSTLIMIDTGKTKTETSAITLPGAGIGFVSTDYAGYHMVRAGSRPARPIFPHRKELPVRWQTIVREEWNKVFRKAMAR